MKLRTIQGILLGVVIGVAVGIGVYTFAYAKGWSYLTDDPAACANCIHNFFMTGTAGLLGNLPTVRFDLNIVFVAARGEEK
jgi:hypothetical protein